MTKPKVLIFSGYGLNCERETKFAFDQVGGKTDIVHINDCSDNKNKLSNYQIIVFPGGFSYGDDTGSGNAFANKVKNHLWEEMLKFVKQDKLVIGICNGFQILVNLGLLPATEEQYGKREVALIHNDSRRYVVKWVDVSAEGQSPWLIDVENLFLPIAHGEGKFYADKKILEYLNKNNYIALRYSGGNPNGSLDDVAGITDKSGRIFGLMPHPERAIFFTQRPDWTFIKEKYKREGKKIPKNGSGLVIFNNAINYFLK